MFGLFSFIGLILNVDLPGVAAKRAERGVRTYQSVPPQRRTVYSQERRMGRVAREGRTSKGQLPLALTRFW